MKNLKNLVIFNSMTDKATKYNRNICGMKHLVDDSDNQECDYLSDHEREYFEIEDEDED